MSKSSSPAAYAADNITDYRKQLASFDLAQLHDHAVRMGVVPFDDESLLKRALEVAFKKGAKPITVPRDLDPDEMAGSDEYRDDGFDEPEEEPTPRRKRAAKQSPDPEPEPKVEEPPANPLCLLPRKRDVDPAKPVPKWRAFVDRMLAENATYGTVFSTADLETELGLKREEPAFGFTICRIRQTLIGEGLYLTSRGQKGEQFIILPAARNADVMTAYSHRASNMLRDGIVLGANTSRDTMTAEEKRRHESTLEKLAHKSVLMHRTEKAWAELEASKTGKQVIAYETVGMVGAT